MEASSEAHARHAVHGLLTEKAAHREDHVKGAALLVKSINFLDQTSYIPFRSSGKQNFDSAYHSLMFNSYRLNLDVQSGRKFPYSTRDQVNNARWIETVIIWYPMPYHRFPRSCGHVTFRLRQNASLLVPGLLGVRPEHVIPGGLPT